MTSKIITYTRVYIMYIAVEHVNNFPITLTIEWNDNGDICIHAGNLFSHHICYVTSKNKTTKTEEKIQMCQMDIIRVCCLLGSVKKKKMKNKVFQGFLIEFLWPFVRSAVLQTEMDFKCNKINVILSGKGHLTIFFFKN